MEFEWEDGFEHLEEYVAAHGDALVPARHVSPDGYRLGKWVEGQRSLRGKLGDRQKRRLGAVKGWIWDTSDLHWQKEYEYLEEFVAAYGDANVPIRHKSPDGFKLGRWVERQRRHRDTMDRERKISLENLTGWIWQISR